MPLSLRIWFKFYFHNSYGQRISLQQHLGAFRFDECYFFPVFTVSFCRNESFCGSFAWVSHSPSRQELFGLSALTLVYYYVLLSSVSGSNLSLLMNVLTPFKHIGNQCPQTKLKAGSRAQLSWSACPGILVPLSLRYTQLQFTNFVSGIKTSARWFNAIVSVPGIC